MSVFDEKLHLEIVRVPGSPVSDLSSTTPFSQRELTADRARITGKGTIVK